VHIIIGKDPIAKKPSCFTHEMAAAVPLVALTAFSCLDWLPKERKEKGWGRVVVAGASGGVGMWCVQCKSRSRSPALRTNADGERIVAKKLYKDCHVTGICSAKNADFVRKLGADEVRYTSLTLRRESKLTRTSLKVIDYSSEFVAQALMEGLPAGKRYDLYIDCVGGTEIFPDMVRKPLIPGLEYSLMTLVQPSPLKRRVCHDSW
jgi:NADPH:quinone reductase-like Zn-dependent oxidoreductase